MHLPVAAAAACVLGVGLGLPGGLPARNPPWVVAAAWGAPVGIAMALVLLLVHKRCSQRSARWILPLGVAVLLMSAFLVGAGRAYRPVQPGPPAARPVELQAEVLRVGENAGLPWLLVEPETRGDAPQRLWVQLAVPTPPPAPGAIIRVEGLLQREAGQVRMEKAAWRLAGGGFKQLRFRERIRIRLFEILPEEDAGLACALLLGESRAAPEELQSSYRDLGLVHLLCVSGMHLWLWDAWLRLLLRGRTRVLRLPLLFFVALLAGLQPPVLRAAAALALREFCVRRGLQAAPLSLWSAAVWVELLLIPARPAGLGFVLSYSATFALLATRSHELRHPAASLFAASLAATLGAQPWLFRATGLLQPWSPLLSPGFALLLPIRIAASAFALIPGADGIAEIVLRMVRIPEAALLAILERLPAVPYAAPHLGDATILAGSAIGLIALRALIRTRHRSATVLACVAAGLIFAPRGASPGVLALPVGHGLAMVIGSAERSLVFDCGSAHLAPERLVRSQLLPELRRRAWKWPEAFVLSHTDRDHRNAIPELMQIQTLEEHRVAAGEVVEIESLAGWRVRLYGLEPELRGAANAEGQALELRRGEQRVILLGDPWGHALLDFCRRIPAGPVDLLMLPHHGRTTEGVAELLEHLQPRECWIRAQNPPIRSSWSYCGEVEFAFVGRVPTRSSFRWTSRQKGGDPGRRKPSARHGRCSTTRRNLRCHPAPRTRASRTRGDAPRPWPATHNPRRHA